MACCHSHEVEFEVLGITHYFLQVKVIILSGDVLKLSHGNCIHSKIYLLETFRSLLS